MSFLPAILYLGDTLTRVVYRLTMGAALTRGGILSYKGWGEILLSRAVYPSYRPCYMIFQSEYPFNGWIRLQWMVYYFTRVGVNWLSILKAVLYNIA